MYSISIVHLYQLNFSKYSKRSYKVSFDITVLIYIIFYLYITYEFIVKQNLGKYYVLTSKLG